MNALTRILAIFAALMMVAPSVWAQDAPPADTDGEVSDEIEEDDEIEESYRESKEWSVSAGLSTSIYQGTFAAVEPNSEFEGVVEDADNAYDRWNIAWGVDGSYTFLDDYSAYVSFAGVQWLTAAGGSNESAEHRFQDIGAGLQWSGYTIDPADLTVSANVSFGFPTSNISRFANLILDTGAGASLAWRGIDGLTLSYSLSGGKSFHSSKYPTIDGDEFDDSFARDNDAALLSGGDIVAVDSGLNYEWNVNNSFAAALSLWDFSLSISYVLSDFWTYSIENDDEFTAENASAGRGHAQVQRGSVTLAYSFSDFAKSIGLSSFSVNAGLRTASNPLSDDQQTVNFPFWNFNGAARNSSAIRFGVSAAY